MIKFYYNTNSKKLTSAQLVLKDQGFKPFKKTHRKELRYYSS